jgi:hypothetical protein
VDVGWMGGRMWDVEVSTVLLCWSCNDHRPASIGAEVFYLNDNTGDPRLEQTERHNTYPCLPPWLAPLPLPPRSHEKARNR